MCTNENKLQLSDMLVHLRHSLGNHLAVIGSLIAVCKNVAVDDPDFARVVANAEGSYGEILALLQQPGQTVQ
ncbi:MAG: hypothetical protein ACD_62C00247G0014 [uncultured bacterium]|nr:MAG: hypothetical protein ACD_62C00247G0014 [uncultured bacterium]HLD44776.1 hypothetical protein [bacterium]